MTNPKIKDREYLGWADANMVEWRLLKEQEGRRNWIKYWGCWMKEYERWICSGINRAMRKPSFRSLEWLNWQRKCGFKEFGPCNSIYECESPPEGEWNTRKSVLMEPKRAQCCRPCPWPITTAGEVGWLGQHRSCQLEIYGRGYMQKPPLPAYQPKISSFLSNSQ